MEEIWSLDCNMDEFALKRLEDGTWMFKSGIQGEYGEPTVFLDRKQLKDLHSVLEQELYPERFLPPTTKPIIWEERPNGCPVCGALLRHSRYREGIDFCPKHHGKTFTFTIDDKKKWGWYTLQIGDAREE